MIEQIIALVLNQSKIEIKYNNIDYDMKFINKTLFQTK